jgi:hypothetical protein
MSRTYRVTRRGYRRRFELDFFKERKVLREAFEKVHGPQPKWAYYGDEGYEYRQWNMAYDQWCSYHRNDPNHPAFDDSLRQSIRWNYRNAYSTIPMRAATRKLIHDVKKGRDPEEICWPCKDGNLQDIWY